MEYTALLSGLIGALIGSLTSIGTLLVRANFEREREMRRLTFEVAFKDYELRVLHSNEHTPQIAPFPVILAFHEKMLQLMDQERLTPDAAKEILDAQGDMSRALYEALESAQAPERP
jgi:hypothetical protein